MDAGGIQDKSLWAVIALAVAGLLGFFKSENARRARRRAEKAAKAAAAAEHAAVEERRKAEQAQADAALAMEREKIAGMTDDELLSDAKARIDRGGAEPRTGLFNPPPRR